MSTPIWMMDPRAPTGLWIALEAPRPDAYPDNDRDGRHLQLTDASLESNGSVLLSLLDDQDAPVDGMSLEGVETLNDGSVMLALSDGSRIVFKAKDAARVNATILKLANAQF